MTDCAACGHELGIGRYCTNCGLPVGGPVGAPADDWRTGTAERPRTLPVAAPVAPTAPPPAWTPAPAPRFPLYADEVADTDAPLPPIAHRRPSRSGSGWVALLVVAVMLVALCAWLLATGDDDSPIATPPTSSAPGSPPASAPATETPQEQPSSPAPTSLTAGSQVTVPETAGPGKDADGNPVSYRAANMLDGVPETCWRMAGDGTGADIVVTLPAETRLRSVGMINGYAKQTADRDWYHGNRRVEQVEWVFDDGTTVPQTLGDTASVQSVDVDVTTTTITLRLVAVSAPGTGPSRRDFTAISDLLLVGAAG
jgi:hypothetical protein